MRTSVAAVAIALASFATAQLPNVPSCSLNCFVSALGSDGCSSLTDFACHCQKPDLVSTITPCVQKACSVADQQSVISTVEDTCKSAGHPITISAVPGSSAASSAASSAPASSAPASSAVVTSAASAASSAVSSAASSAVSTVTSVAGTSAIVTSSNATATSTSQPSQFTGNGAAQVTQAAGFVAAAALALAAAL